MVGQVQHTALFMRNTRPATTYPHFGPDAYLQQLRLSTQPAVLNSIPDGMQTFHLTYDRRVQSTFRSAHVCQTRVKQT